MTTEFSHDTYISPYTWRYGSAEMRGIFSEVHKRKLLRRVWIALARAEMKAGLVSEEQLAELEAHMDDINIERAAEIENTIHHDLMAEIRTYAEQCPKAGGIIHLGATSMDALDNADAIRFREAMDIIIRKTAELADEFAKKAEEYKAVATMAFTHIQPAEVTTIGYRLSQTLQDLADDLDELVSVRDGIRGKGMKGAVGTAASYHELLEGSNITSVELEDMVMSELGIRSYDAATQIYSRKQDLRIIASLSSLACTLHKFSQDFRILQSPPIGEFSEPFGKFQVGSSAMPFKRNPINSEKIDSLCRLIEGSYQSAWMNAATTVLERSLDDSANRRVFISESFIAADEILMTELKIVKGMNVHSDATDRLMRNYGIFASTERLLMELGKKGADRQVMHEVIREESLRAWAILQEGGDNPLLENLITDQRILEYLSQDQIKSLLNADSYVGDAEERTERVIKSYMRRRPALNSAK